MRFLSLFLCTLIVQIFSPTLSFAKVKATINLSSQTMTVRVDGRTLYRWPVSSGKSGFLTPRGSFRPHRVVAMHYSSKYNNAPMPYSVFFNGGIAVHGTGKTYKLGQPASHGCVRLSVNNARRFHNLVKSRGKRNTHIKVVGYTPAYRSAKTRRRSVKKRRSKAKIRRHAVKPRRNKRKRTAKRRKKKQPTYYNDPYYYEEPGPVYYYD